MHRTAWKGFGDSPAGRFDPANIPAFNEPPNFTFGPAAGNGATLAELIAAADARAAALVNVDPLTALQSRISAAVPTGARLPLILAGMGLLALLLTPSGAGGRR